MITVYVIGKTKPLFVKEGIKEYLTRLGKYTPLTYKEIEKLPLCKGFIIALDVTGKAFSSEDFSLFLNKKMFEHKDLTFVIGGAEGFDKTFLKEVDFRLSLSLMTFPHDLVRVLF